MIELVLLLALAVVLAALLAWGRWVSYSAMLRASPERSAFAVALASHELKHRPLAYVYPPVRNAQRAASRGERVAVREAVPAYL